MEIHLVSSLTSEDETRLAPQMLAAIEHILNGLPVTYSVRIETSSGSEIHRSHTAAPLNGVSAPEDISVLAPNLPAA